MDYVIVSVIGFGLVAPAAWVLLRLTRFRLFHLVVAVLTFGVSMLPMQWVPVQDESREPIVLLVAICFAVLTSLGIHFGIRNEMACAGASPGSLRVAFMAGLFAPLPALPCMISCIGLLSSVLGHIFSDVEMLGILAVFFASLLCIGFTAKCVHKLNKLEAKSGDSQP